MTAISRSPDLAEVLRIAQDQRQSEIHTHLPGRVESYNLATQKADIKPLLKTNLVNADGNDVIEELPVIPSVPVGFFRTANAFISFPMKKGDLVTLLIIERSIDKYTHGKGVVTDPGDTRMHQLIDAVALPCLYPFDLSLADAHADNLVMGFDGGAQIHVKSGGIALGAESPVDHVALALLTNAELQVIVTAFLNHGHNTTATVGPSAVPGLVSAPITPALGVPPVSAIIPDPPGDVKSNIVESE